MISPTFLANSRVTGRRVMPSLELSPYVVTALEVVTSLGTSEARKTILRGWLLHRAALRAVGLDRGFQWLDGSFVEDKVLKDLDVVSFTYVWFAVSHAAPLRLCRGVAANPSQARSERGG
jgi:hypothetical protein